MVCDGRASHQAGEWCRVDRLKFSLAPQAVSFKSWIRIDHTKGRLASVHLHAAWLASTNDVLPALQRTLNQDLAADRTTHPAGPTTKTARVLETRPDLTPENLLIL